MPTAPKTLDKGLQALFNLQLQIDIILLNFSRKAGIGDRRILEITMPPPGGASWTSGTTLTLGLPADKGPFQALWPDVCCEGIQNIDEPVKSQLSDGFVKSSRSRLANLEE